MDTLPLPPHCDFAQLELRAQELRAAAASSDPAAVRTWATQWLGAIASAAGVEITPFVRHSFERTVDSLEQLVRAQVAEKGAQLPRADAELLIARAHGFPSWGALALHVEGPRDAPGRSFEAAADAVVGGDLPILQSLLRAHPELIRARSSRLHAATLLHYVAANGVEDFRQRTPPNAVEIAEQLLDAGAEVDALAQTYGGGRAQTTLNLLVSSAHPHTAGLQSNLVEVLLDGGAAIDGLDGDGSPLMTALGFWYGGAAETLARRGARLENAVAAASVGRLDVVKRLVVDRETLAPEVRCFETPWFATPRDPRAHIEMAFAGACHYRRADVADFFLELGVSPRSQDKDGMTALHWAAATGSMDFARRLLQLGAELEVKNTWGGTVLDSTAYFAVNMPIDGVDYRSAMEALIAAGAEVGVLRAYPRGHAVLDELRRRYRVDSS